MGRTSVPCSFGPCRILLFGMAVNLHDSMSEECQTHLVSLIKHHGLFVPYMVTHFLEKDSNPLGRRRSVAPATDENADAPKVSAKVKAGYEANAAPAKKGRVANPFARAR